MKTSFAYCHQLGLSMLLLLLSAPLASADPYAMVRSFTSNKADAVSFKGAAVVGTRVFNNTFDSLVAINLDGTNKQTIHTFSGGINDGSSPSGALASDGVNVYGATVMGGAHTVGTVWTIKADGSGFHLLTSFPDTGNGVSSNEPIGGVTLLGTSLYGTSYDGGIGLFGGNGTVFRVGVGGGATEIHAFNNSEGSKSQERVISNGTAIFGSAPKSESDSSNGVVFKVSSGGGYSILHTFVNPDGSSPRVIGAAATDVIGATSAGIFTMKTDGTGFHIISMPSASELTLVGNRLYGTTTTGGANNLGQLFSINGDGTGLQLLHSFTGGLVDGKAPDSGLMLIGSTLYGTTSSGGVNNTGTLFALQVPEPSSFVLAAVGLAGMCGIWRKRRSRRTFA